jgi:hypothetical protein
VAEVTLIAFDRVRGQPLLNAEVGEIFANQVTLARRAVASHAMNITDGNDYCGANLPTAALARPPFPRRYKVKPNHIP